MSVYITAAPLLPGELPIKGFGTLQAKADSIDRAIDKYLPNSPSGLRAIVTKRVTAEEAPEDTKLVIIAGLQAVKSVIELVIILAQFDERDFEAKIAGEGEVR